MNLFYISYFDTSDIFLIIKYNDLILIHIEGYINNE